MILERRVIGFSHQNFIPSRVRQLAKIRLRHRRVFGPATLKTIGPQIAVAGFNGDDEGIEFIGIGHAITFKEEVLNGIGHKSVKRHVARLGTSPFPLRRVIGQATGTTVEAMHPDMAQRESGENRNSKPDFARHGGGVGECARHIAVAEKAKSQKQRRQPVQ